MCCRKLIRFFFFILFFLGEIALSFSDRGSEKRNIFESDYGPQPVGLTNELSAIDEMQEPENLINSFMKRWNITMLQ